MARTRSAGYVDQRETILARAAEMFAPSPGAQLVCSNLPSTLAGKKRERMA